MTRDSVCVCLRPDVVRVLRRTVDDDDLGAAGHARMILDRLCRYVPPHTVRIMHADTQRLACGIFQELHPIYEDVVSWLEDNTKEDSA